MANITKTQIRKRISEILDKLREGLTELDDLKYEVEEERDNIEPYDYCDELTPEQEERQEWLDECANALEEVLDSVDVDSLEEWC